MPAASDQITGAIDEDPSVYELDSWDLPGRAHGHKKRKVKKCLRISTNSPKANYTTGK